MLMPFLGFVFSVAVVIGLAAVAIMVDRRLRPIGPALVAFVPSAFAGAILYGLVYGQAFADDANMLQTRAQVIGLLFGLPSAAGIVGWAGARLFSRYWTRRRVP